MLISGFLRMPFVMYSWVEKNCWLKSLGAPAHQLPIHPPSPRKHSSCWLHPSRSQVSTAGTNRIYKIHSSFPFPCKPRNHHHPIIGQYTWLMYPSDESQCDWLWGFPGCLPFFCPLTCMNGGDAVPGQGACKVLPKLSHQTGTHPRVSIFLACSPCVLPELLQPLAKKPTDTV